MPNFDIESFRAKFQAGARGYLFYVKPVFPLGLGADTDTATYLVRTASLPESTNEVKQLMVHGTSRLMLIKMQTFYSGILNGKE